MGDNPQETFSPSVGGNEGIPAQPAIVFPVTGKSISAALLEYGMDVENDVKKFAKTPDGKKAVQIARSKGMTGTDEEILLNLYKNPLMMQEIYGNNEESDSDDDASAQSATPSPALLMSIYLGSPVYTFTSDYIRADMTGNPMANMFGASPVTIIDLKGKVSYSVINLMGLSAAIKSPVNHSTNEIGFTDYFLKITNANDASVTKKTGKFGEYQCAIHSIEVPVKEGKDADGKPDHSLYKMHALLSGDPQAMLTDDKSIKYSPAYKLFIEACFTNDLDAKLPAQIDWNMERAQKNPGLMVAYILRDENGNEAIYKLKNVTLNQPVDEGQFQIPQGYDIVTQEEFDQKLKSKYNFKNIMKQQLRTGGQ